MKEIGEKLKEARENMGVSIEEAAEDLKIRPSQVENIEAGNRDAFEDVFYLKQFIREYAKYLGLNKENMVDEFNEYLFDLTSRLSLSDIKEAKNEEVKAHVQSPYTKEAKKKMTFIPFLIYTIIILLIVSIIYFVVTINNDNDLDEGSFVTENK